MPEGKQPGFSLRWPLLAARNPPLEKAPRAAGDETQTAAAAELVRAHVDFVWKVVRRLGISANRADDLTQEVFLVAMRRGSEIKAGSERAFLYAAAVRVVANARRQERRRREAGDAELEQLAAGALPDEIVEQQRTAAELDAVLDELPDKLRRVLVLSDVLELDVGEVAELERIPRGTVASRLKRARLLFKRKVSQRDLATPGAIRGPR